MVELRPLDMSPSGIETTCELLRAVYPHAPYLTPRYLEVLYFGNPLGPTFGIGAWQDGRLVAHYLMIPIKARLFGEEELGIWPFQLATHPQYQGKGLFSTMNAAAMDESRARGFGFYSGVGNDQSSPIFVKKFNCQAVRQLDVKVGVGAVPRRRDVEGLDIQFVRVWDAEGLAWRLRLAEPPYRVRRRGEEGTIFANTRRFGIHAQLGTYPSAWFPGDMRPLNTWNPLRLWMGLDPTRDWRGSLYRDLPERFKPSPLTLLFRDLTDHGRELDPAKVQYDAFDFDPY